MIQRQKVDYEDWLTDCTNREKHKVHWFLFESLELLRATSVTSHTCMRAWRKPWPQASECHWFLFQSLEFLRATSHACIGKALWSVFQFNFENSNSPLFFGAFKSGTRVGEPFANFFSLAAPNASFQELVHVCMYMCMYVCIYVICICMYACMHAYINCAR